MPDASPMPLIRSLDEASRFARPAIRSDRVAATEWAILLAAGAVSAVISLSVGGFRIPGSAILQAVLPMAAGLALVPRRGSGLTMGTAALACGVGMRGIAALGVAHVNPSELARLFLLGVCLEVGPARASDKRFVWLWFVTAGLAANLLGFAIKMGMGQLGWEGIGRHSIPWPVRLTSFAVCGAVAGGISAVIFFRRGAARNGREDTRS
jgi:hypothetical protein